ncbi:MAG TPA: FeoA family protein [Bacteroidota bacterium]|nr:FeoA family protein [Bacteroidota bacterium]
MRRTTLNTLSPGDRGTVEQVQSKTSSIKQRLLEMGLTRGTPVELIRFAPMGDPIEISVRGYRLSLRKVEAESVVVVQDQGK